MIGLARRFANWVRTDYPEPVLGEHLVLIALCGNGPILEVVKDADGVVWGGWSTQDRERWVRLS